MEITLKQKRFLGISLIIISIVLLVSFTYGDILYTTRHGINFWNSLFSGRILFFYQDNIGPCGNIHYSDVVGCAYNILVYVCFAIWNFPLWLMEKLSIDVMNNIPCLIWANLLPVFSTCVAAYILGQILRIEKVSRDRICFSQYFYLSSSLILTTVLISSRYDSLCSCLMLLALLNYKKNDTKAFIIWSGIAFCFNYLSALAFLPLLLLREKKVGRIIKLTIFMLIPYIITTIPFWFHPIPDSGKMETDLFHMLFSRTNGRFSWFVIIYILVLFYAYRADEQTTGSWLPIWLCFCALASLFAFSLTYPYWPILLSPYIALIIAKKEKEDNINILVETIGLGALVLENMFYYFWCYVGKPMYSMVISVLLPNKVFQNHEIYDFWVKMRDKSTLILILHSVFIAALIIMAIINHPDRKKEKSEVMPMSEYTKVSHILIIRWVSTMVICLLPFLVLIK